MIMKKCYVQCFKPTKFWDMIYKQRGVYGNDQVPATPTIAGHATRACGFPVELDKQKTKECKACTSLECLEKARMACYKWQCKSPFVKVGGMMYYVPKTVVIGKVGN